jgi:hypothetical protein
VILPDHRVRAVRPPEMVAWVKAIGIIPGGPALRSIEVPGEVSRE